MKSKIELLKELIGKEVVIEWSDRSNAFALLDYSKYNISNDFQKELGHHLILDVGSDMIKTKWLGQKSLPKLNDLSGYFCIAYIFKIEIDI